MDMKVRIVVVLISLAWLICILRLVKNRRIWERYALFWVYIGFGVFLFPIVADLVDPITYALGVDEPQNFYFLVGILGILGILLQYTVEITTLVRRSRDTVQDMAILEERVRHLESELEKARGERTAAT